MASIHHDVFISHSSEDKAVADAVCAKLESQGVRCWIAPRDILPGTNWGEAIVQAIGDSLVMVVVFSSHANISEPVVREVERAVNKKVIVLPFRVENVAPSGPLEFFLSSAHWLDALTPPLEGHLQHLAETVQVLLAKRTELARGVPPHEERTTDLEQPSAVPAEGLSPFPLLVEERGSYLEALPVAADLQIRALRYGTDSTQVKSLSLPFPIPSLPRRFDPEEGKWKLDTKDLSNSVTPSSAPNALDLLVQPAESRGTIYALAAVDEFYLLPSTVVDPRKETVISNCRIGRPGITEFAYWTKSKQLVLVKRDTHPYVLGNGQGALNLLFLVQVTDQARVRSCYYPVIRQGVLTPEDLFHWKGRCFVSPDGRRIAVQSLSPRGDRTSVYTCEVDGTACRHVAGALPTSTVLRLPSQKIQGGWTDQGRLKVFVKDAAANAWRPCLLEDADNARPIYV
ncbi:MAG: toll/interleukin-1 receptor domain-containing protein [Planctomycetes bacterium]|nr:toll/interleukin-1 receptor domain-containing protein [Planctomycetota bacterium]